MFDVLRRIGAERGSRTPTRLLSSVFEFADGCSLPFVSIRPEFAERSRPGQSVRRRSPKFALTAVKPLSTESCGGCSMEDGPWSRLEVLVAGTTTQAQAVPADGST